MKNENQFDLVAKPQIETETYQKHSFADLKDAIVFVIVRFRRFYKYFKKTMQTRCLIIALTILYQLAHCQFLTKIVTWVSRYRFYLMIKAPFCNNGIFRCSPREVVFQSTGHRLCSWFCCGRNLYYDVMRRQTM